MSNISIRDGRLQRELTILTDIFIDEYMPEADGTSLKVYLFLIRQAHSSEGLSFTRIREALSLSEDQLQAALSFWEQAGLLSFTFRKERGREKIQNIELLPVLPLEENETAGKFFASLNHSRNPENRPNAEGDNAPESASASVSDSVQTAEVHTAVPASGNLSSEGQTSRRAVTETVPELSSSRMKELKESKEARQILFITETYLGRPLTTTDMRRILYLYDGLGFSFDLIDYLTQYCVNKGKKSLRYIEAVGLAWHQEGIRTLEDAKASTEFSASKVHYQIFKLFGIRSHDPILPEIQIMDRWTKEYGFTMELIGEAARKTLAAIHEPSLSYADSILTSWHHADVKNLDDVARIDAAHKAEVAAAYAKEASSAAVAGSGQGSVNRFNDFAQRDYDYDKLTRERRSVPKKK